MSPPSEPQSEHSSTRAALSVPPGIDACLFDLDGVLTRTAVVHNAAWKEMFDVFLRAHADRTGEPFRPFEESDYISHVDGRMRADGTFVAEQVLARHDETYVPKEVADKMGLAHEKYGVDTPADQAVRQ